MAFQGQVLCRAAHLVHPRGTGRAARDCQGYSPNSGPSSRSALSGAPPEQTVLKQSNKVEHRPGSWVLDRGPW